MPTRNINPAIKNNVSYQKKLVKYFIQCIISEGSKIVMFSIFFWKWNRFSEFAVALFMLMLLRTNGGGIHCKHYISCLLLSFAMMFGTIVLAIEVFLPALLIKIIIGGCAIIGYVLVPITSENRPPASDAVIQKSKRNTMFIIGGYFILICIVSNNLYINIGFWTITLHICQLLLARVLKERRTT